SGRDALVAMTSQTVSRFNFATSTRIVSTASRSAGASAAWGDGIPDRIALHLQSGLDARSQVEACESLVDAPEVTLEFHRLRPFPARHRSYSWTLWCGTMQAEPAIQPTPPINITAAGICAEAEKTFMRGARFMMDSNRPVLVDASLM